MSSKLALLFCTVFVLFLLRLERKQSPHVSLTLWIPTIWMLYIASKPLAIWFKSGSDDFESGSPLDQYFLAVLLCLGLFILAMRKFNWSRAMNNNIWVMLLISYMLVSVLWSDIPFISFKRWIRELIAVLMAFLILSERDPRQAMQSLFRKTIYILIPFSVLLIKYYPEYGVEYGHTSGGQMWLGVTTQKNSLGRLCLIAAFFLLWTLVRRRQGRDIPVRKYQTLAEVSILILTLLLIRGPGDQYSATALTSLAAGLVAFVGLLWIKKKRINLGKNTLTVIMVLIICFGILQPIIGGSSVSGLTSTLGRESTLTGRTEIWAGLIPVVMQQPILGSGFGGFWTPANRAKHEIGEAHNGYLDLLLDLGIVGLLLASMFLMSSCRKAQREMSSDFDWAILWICYLLMSVIHNITESSLNSFTSYLTAVLIFLSVSSVKATS
jgi:exopolysaccharide production protein ExoQ